MATVATVGDPWLIRPYTDADQPRIDALLDADADPLWVAQGHRLHGAVREGERWRRTLIAERAGRVVGAVTVARNPVHPGRYSLAVEVDPAARRRGLGRRLVERARFLVPERLPLAAKLRPADSAGLALLHGLGGRIYQRCPGLCPDPSAPEVMAWAERNAPADGAAVVALCDLARTEWDELWVRQYRWVHEEWSPAAEQPLRDLARNVVDEADPELSTIAVRRAVVEAVAWVFPEAKDTAAIVAETCERRATSGALDVAAGLARSLSRLRERGVRAVQIDGHVSDPHLAPVLDTLPAVPRVPLYLVEIGPVGEHFGSGRGGPDQVEDVPFQG